METGGAGESTAIDAHADMTAPPPPPPLCPLFVPAALLPLPAFLVPAPFPTPKRSPPPPPWTAASCAEVDKDGAATDAEEEEEEEEEKEAMTTPACVDPWLETTRNASAEEEEEEEEGQGKTSATTSPVALAPGGSAGAPNASTACTLIEERPRPCARATPGTRASAARTS